MKLNTKQRSTDSTKQNSTNADYLFSRINCIALWPDAPDFKTNLSHPLTGSRLVFVIIIINVWVRLVPECVLRFVHIVDACTFWRHRRVVNNCRTFRWLTCLRIHSWFFKLLTTTLDRRMVRLVDLPALG